MDKNMKDNRKFLFFLVAFGVIFFIGLQHLSSVFDFVSKAFSMIAPIVWGFLVAFILNVPMRGIEKLIDKIRHRKRKNDKEVKPINLKLKRAISFTCTIILLLAILAVVGIVVVPKMAESVVSVYNLATTKMPDIIKLLDEHGIDASFITEWINDFNIKKIVDFLSQKDLDLLDFAFKFIGSTVSGIVSVGIALVIAVYTLLGKERIVNGVKKLITVHCREKVSTSVLHVCNLIDEKYAKFLSGQFIESCILGVLIFLVLRIIGVPYASLIGVLTGVCAFVPYIGAFLSCAVGVLLVLLAKPELLIIYIIAYLITQFVENQFIYPHVVGTSVGLHPLLTILAVFIGGELLGVFGMIFFIPLMAVFVTIINEYTAKKALEKESNKI